MGGDAYIAEKEKPLDLVSIHAPAWGATRMGVCPGFKGLVSIHAPAWGATTHHARSNSGHSSFNPRPRMGGDPQSIWRIILE